MSLQRARRHAPIAVLLASGLVATLLLGHIGEAIHYSLVRHARCAEHAEIVHADGPVGGEKRKAGSRVDPVPSGDEAHGHDHCQLAVFDRQRDAVEPPAWTVLGFAPGVHPNRPIRQEIGSATSPTC